MNMNCVTMGLVFAVLTLQVVNVDASSFRAGEPDPSYMNGPGYFKEVAGDRHILGVDKGHLLARVYTECEVKETEAKRIADTVSVKAGQKVKDSKQDEDVLAKKIASASPDDRVKDQLSGESRMSKWMDQVDNEQAEQAFYAKINENAKVVSKKTDTVMEGTIKIRKVINDEFKDMEKLLTPFQEQADQCTFVLEEARRLWQQWLDSTKDYTCNMTTVVQNAKSTCKSGSTKYSRKCAITCMPGYDDPNDSKNTLRCRKEGKFGQQLYGEWKGMASCVGRVCGKAPKIQKAKTLGQDIRFPHAATYNCYEGYSQDGKPKGSKSFSVPCGTTGNFEPNSSHSCQRIKCGSAPVAEGAELVSGIFAFSDILAYRCKPGHTLDATPGGLTNFSTSCEGTGRFTQVQKCKRVRCGPAPEYSKTSLLSEKGEKYYGAELKYECQLGHTTNQNPAGPKKFTLRCGGDGEFADKGNAEIVPQCQPVSAGILPAVAHGNAKQREMFYGQSVVVTADTGYSTTGKPSEEDLSFTVTVTPEGTFAGLKKFIPISCGAPPSVAKAKTSFSAEVGVYGNVLNYHCEDGYSTDRTAATAAKSFAIQCEADAGYSQVPQLGFCVDIDDCAGHTCGAHGDCVDRLMNYTCNCESGFAQNWNNETNELTCGNVDDCGLEACGVGTCKDLVNGFNCICPTGFEETGELDDKTCTAKICGTPPRVANALTSPVEVGFQKASYSSKVVYQCATGYTLDGTPTGRNHFSIDCQANQQFTATKNCMPIKCGVAPVVNHSSLVPATATFNNSVRYTCEKGYTIDGTRTGDKSFGVTCMVTGQYGEVSKCRPVTCGEPDEVPNSFRRDGSLVFKESVTYKCFEGFTLDGNRDGPTDFNVKCHEDGSLDKLKSCLPKVCGVPGKVINALYATTADEGAVAYPRVTEVACRDGYTVGGSAAGNSSFTVACLSTGLFDEFNKYACDPVRCGAAPAMKNATLVRIEPQSDKGHDNLNYEETAFYKCQPGFSTGGELGSPDVFKVECLPSGEFSTPSADMQCRNINDCERHTCGPKGKCVDLVGPSPAYTCDCDFGFELKTKENGEKHCGNTDNCKDKDCGHGVCKDLIGDYTCICPSGYYIGQALDGAKTCVPVQCANNTPTVSNGRMLTRHSGTVDFPTTLQYKCNKGYSIDASVSESKRRFQSQCKPNGQLDGMMSCQRISCGTPKVLQFATLVAPWTPRKSVEYDEKVKYKCRDGYTIGGRAKEFSVTCQDNGVLTDPEVCKPVRCGYAPRVPHSRAAVAGDVFFGMHLQYNCDTGYSLDGTARGAKAFQRHCQNNGAFSDLISAQPCKPAYGGRAPTLQNAVMTEYAGRPVTQFPPSVYYPNGLEYKCNAGYSENGSPNGATKMSSRVNSNGRLSPALPSGCLPITFTIRGQVKDSRNGQSLNGVTVSARGAATNVNQQTSNGFFGLASVRLGNLQLVYKKDGYIDAIKDINVGSNINTGGVADVSMSPKMRSDQWRAVVQWGDQPTDLDTYAKWSDVKVNYQTTRREKMQIKGQLEHDDTDGNGPETIYFTGVGKCTASARHCDIRYEINDYTESGRMKDISGARVTLYTGERVAGTWTIAGCRNTVTRGGNWWHVFTLDGKNNRLKWNCNMGPENPEEGTLNFYHRQARAGPNMTAVANNDEKQRMHTHLRKSRPW